MISVDEAIKIIRSHCSLLPPVTCSLSEALGLALAEDVFAPVNVPHFNQSAMDGYAFRFSDLVSSNEFVISGEVAAGDTGNIIFQPPHAVRIFTGAPVPEGLDTVVMQEKTATAGNHLTIQDDQLALGSNVRKEGDEIKKGDLALPAGSVLHPAAIGFLAGLGITAVKVYPRPIVHIIVTGKELQRGGAPLQHGQVYESNSVMLQTALAQLHIHTASVFSTGDDVAEITSLLKSSLRDADLVLLTGGVSVGDYDFVVSAAEACGVKQLFHKVAQRPGKPLYAGKKDQKLVFGLPGNPSSVLSCFYNYVVVAIECCTGRYNLLQKKQAPLLKSFDKKVALRQFLKGTCNPDGVLPLSAQESFRLSSFSIANCLIDLPEERREFQQGEMVEVLLLPYI